MTDAVNTCRLEALGRPGFRMFAAALLALVQFGSLHAESGYLEPGQAFRLRVNDLGGGELQLHWEIAPGYYLYRDRLQASAPPGQATPQLELPPGEIKADPNFGSVTVYHHSLDVPVHAGSARSVSITWQGCGEQGICYPPQHRSVSLPPLAPSSVPLDAPGRAAFDPGHPAPRPHAGGRGFPRPVERLDALDSHAAAGHP